MDRGSIVGLILGFLALCVGHWMEGGHLQSLIQPAALLIVLGGTLGAVLLQSGWTATRGGLLLLKSALQTQPAFFEALTQSIHTWSSTARIEGFLQLEKFIGDNQDLFVAKGLRLVVDAVDVHEIRNILAIDINSHVRQQRTLIKVWESAGGYAPTVGIMGAVLGLIRVMENLDDPASLGNGIALAFIATLYGVALANLVCLPIANKLKQQLAVEVLKREMLAEAFVSIAKGENHLLIQERMSSHWHKGA
jgi:chemotaxis protein MotA